MTPWTWVVSTVLPLAGVVLTVRAAQHQAGDPRFIAGVLTTADHLTLCLELDWCAILDDERAALGADVGKLVDQALTLAPGAILEGRHEH